MNRILLGLFAILGLLLAGCGGGGGPTASTFTVSGRVLSVVSDGPVNPSARIQVGATTATTNAADGSFSIVVPSGTTSLTVDTLSSFGVFVFTIPPVTADTDAGDLWVGPEKVTVTGTVRNSTDSTPVANAAVSFGGVLGKTNANGVFTLANVAYSTDSIQGFFSVVGSARATGFFASNFSATQPAVSSVVTVDDILLTPSTDTTPPPGPYNIWGRINPSSLAAGTLVTLSQSGNAIRQFTVGSDGKYFFWVPAGTYTISFANGAHTAPNQNVTLAQQNQVVEKDATLN